MTTITTQRLLSGVDLRQPLTPALSAVTVSGLAYDSRQVTGGEAFFAFPGANVDGRKFAGDALAHQASIVLSELPPPPDAPAAWRDRWIEVLHGRRALALACRNFFGDLSASSVAVAGITGTNGKTTTSFLIDSVLRSGAYETALIGTIEYRLAGEIRKAVNTTPESLDIYRLLAELQSRRATAPLALTMEASSHALDLGRIWGLTFRSAVFTNFTRDHLDYHGTMENYFAAKCELFRGQDAPAPAFAILNADDPYAAQIPLAYSTESLTYSIDAPSRLRATRIASTFAGLSFTIDSPAGPIAISSPLTGRINVYNILAATGVGLSFGLDPATIARGIAACRAVPGRFERVEAGQPFLVIVDYAHTDDALRNVLRVARELNPRRLIVLFGCGGDRDRAKRPLMGRAAGEAADYVIVTSDNPRKEDPAAIINDALVGVQRFTTPHEAIVDRRHAIERAITLAQSGDIVIIAGKGHEDYQIFRDRTIHFDDREVAREILAAHGYRDTAAANGQGASA